jgi:hypothetical protein
MVRPIVPDKLTAVTAAQAELERQGVTHRTDRSGRA